jgi:opacity protein-like surface antigen
MKKRIFLALLIAVLATSAAFAQINLSAGGGLFFDNDFGGGYKASYSKDDLSISRTAEIPYTGMGIYGFFDAAYAELSIGYFFGDITVKRTEKEAYSGYSNSVSPSYVWKAEGFNLSVFGKFPININDKFTLFPLLGSEYKFVRSVNVKEKEIPYTNSSYFNALWFKAGVGGDISFTEIIFLRLNLLYGIRLSNDFEDKYVSDYTSDKLKAETLLGHGLTIKAAVGFKF